MNEQQFINTFWPYAKQVQTKYRIPALVALAQAALESGWGKSTPGHMLFGIKAGSSWKGEKQLLTTSEYHDTNTVKYPEIISIEKLDTGRYKYKVKTWFRKYNSFAESFDDYGKLLSGSERYKNAFTYSDPYKFAAEIAKAGYSTSKDYYTQLAKIINGLQKESPTNQYIKAIAAGVMLGLVINLKDQHDYAKANRSKL